MEESSNSANSVAHRVKSFMRRKEKKKKTYLIISRNIYKNIFVLKCGKRLGKNPWRPLAIYSSHLLFFDVDGGGGGGVDGDDGRGSANSIPRLLRDGCQIVNKQPLPVTN